MFVYSDLYEGGGVLFRSAVNRIFVGLVLSQCVLIGILLTSHAYFAPIVLLPCPFITLSTLKEFEKIYFQPSCIISLERAVEIDRSDNRLSSISFIDAKYAYRQPVLLEDVVKPRLREETDSNFGSCISEELADVNETNP